MPASSSDDSVFGKILSVLNPFAICTDGKGPRRDRPEFIAGAWLGTHLSQDSEGPHAVFCFGSNGIEQMRTRCQNPDLEARKAVLPHAARCFASWDEKWQGAVASVIPCSGAEVRGSVVELSAEELKLLDTFENTDSKQPYAPSPSADYRRQDVVVVCDGHPMPAVMYVILDLKWKGPPSRTYLAACQRNIEQFWSAHQAVLQVRDGAGQLKSTYHGSDEEAMKDGKDPRRGVRATRFGPGIGALDSLAGEKTERLC